MARTMLASATVDFGTRDSGDGRTDVAVPVGTTVAGLLAMLRVDSADPDLTVTLADGRPAELTAALGADLPSGVRLSVARGRSAREARAHARLRSTSARFGELAATSAGLLLATGLGAAVAAPLVVPGISAAQPTRIAAALLGLLVLALVARRTRLLDRPAEALAVPGLAGLAATAVVDPGWTGAAGLAAVVGTISAALVAAAARLRSDSGAAAASAGLWGVTALVAALGVLASLTPAQVGTALLCIGVLAVTLAPGFALRVPESQLLDLTGVTTSAPSVRAAEPAPPGRITRRRVSATLDRAAAGTDAAGIGGTALAVVGGSLLVPAAQPATLTGQAALVALAAATLALALVTRDNRSPVARTVPRAGAAVLAAAAGAGLVAQAAVPVSAVAAALMVLAGAVVFGAVRTVRPNPSALATRLADLVQGLALVALLPAAVLASGLFDQVWRWAS